MSELIYPDAPGFKAAGSSEEAAEKTAGRANVMRATVLTAFRNCYPQGRTADEIASSLNMTVLSVRPRVSELHRSGLLANTGQRRTNSSGMSATVWRFVPQSPPALTSA
jgi:hypothetical protein